MFSLIKKFLIKNHFFNENINYLILESFWNLQPKKKNIKKMDTIT